MTESNLLSRRDLLLAGVLLLLIVVLAGGMGVYVLSAPSLKQANAMAVAAVIIRDNYAEPFDWRSMIDAGRREMLSRLDRYSGYIERDLFNRMNEEFTGSYGGIGVTVVPHESGLLIMSVREGGPAARVGLLSGDIIIRADSFRLAGMSADESSELLRGGDGTAVVVDVVRPSGDDTVSVKITREKIDLLHIPFAGFTPDSIVYIRLLDFQAGASDDLEAALDSLLERKPDPPGIILDLRDNPGGLFSEAYRTASLFLDPGKLIVGTDARSRWEEERHHSSGPDITGGLPLVVLVDKGTASSAEIVAGALRQLGRAQLAGDTTFGKGLVQGFTRFSDGSGLRLTISRYYLEGGVYLNEFDTSLHDTGHGLAPDIPLDFVDRRDFPRALEQSLLLQEFAHAHEDDIIDHPESFALDQTWLDRFRQFADERGFVYRSDRTEAVQVMIDIAQLENSRPDVLAAAARLHDISAAEDGRAFDVYRSYIASRLKQIAFERRFGSYRMYRDVIVRERLDIASASRLLMENRP
ncbi:MAG: S41 family peptidase [candidate division Zixibacteria bacterium]|jgi:carboxyl-terminal processing protease|nr:S41 family peptidase [candidate division Zixibacteria bacterium]